MAKVKTNKECFFKGKRYQKGETLDYEGTKKDMPKYFDELEKSKPEKQQAEK